LRFIARSIGAVVEKRVGVECFIAEIVIHGAVQSVCARLLHDGDDAARVASVFGVVVVLKNAELGDGVRIRIYDYAIREQVIVVAAIQQEGN
jgi:predicted RNA-binding protein with TRAM domain